VNDAGRLRHFARFLLAALLFSVPLSASDGEYSGMVWKRQGGWHLNGSASALRLGEAIPLGGLLTADAAGDTHSLLVLLPDGQRLLCECYEAGTCAQGFRVPAIASPPTAAVWTMFVGVRNALLMRPATGEAPFPEPVGRDIDAANVEIVAAVDAQGKVAIVPALRVLPSGHYRFEVRGDSPQPGATTAPSVQPMDWDPARASAQIRVPGPGLYRITVRDEARVPRIEMELLATPAGAVASEADGLKKMRLTVVDWSRTHEGWSLHDFLRAYLQSRAIALPQ
jgi:hypothetical protein